MFEPSNNDDSVHRNQALMLCGIGAGVGLGTCGVGALVEDQSISPVLLTVGAFLFWGGLFSLLILGLLSILQVFFDRLPK